MILLVALFSLLLIFDFETYHAEATQQRFESTHYSSSLVVTIQQSDDYIIINNVTVNGNLRLVPHDTGGAIYTSLDIVVENSTITGQTLFACAGPGEDIDIHFERSQIRFHNNYFSGDGLFAYAEQGASAVVFELEDSDLTISDNLFNSTAEVDLLVGREKSSGSDLEFIITRSNITVKGNNHVRDLMFAEASDAELGAAEYRHSLITLSGNQVERECRVAAIVETQSSRKLTLVIEDNDFSNVTSFSLELGIASEEREAITIAGNTFKSAESITIWSRESPPSSPSSLVDARVIRCNKLWQNDTLYDPPASVLGLGFRSSNICSENTVRFELVRCDNLPDLDPLAFDTDPIVEICLAGVCRWTPEIVNSEDPVFNWQANFVVKDVQTNVLRMTIWDEDHIGGKELVGFVYHHHFFRLNKGETIEVTKPVANSQNQGSCTYKLTALDFGTFTNEEHLLLSDTKYDKNDTSSTRTVNSSTMHFTSRSHYAPSRTTEASTNRTLTSTVTSPHTRTASVTQTAATLTPSVAQTLSSVKTVTELAVRSPPLTSTMLKKDASETVSPETTFSRTLTPSKEVRFTQSLDDHPDYCGSSSTIQAARGILRSSPNQLFENVTVYAGGGGKDGVLGLGLFSQQDKPAGSTVGTWVFQTQSGEDSQELETEYRGELHVTIALIRGLRFRENLTSPTIISDSHTNLGSLINIQGELATDGSPAQVELKSLEFVVPEGEAAAALSTLTVHLKVPVGAKMYSAGGQIQLKILVPKTIECGEWLDDNGPSQQPNVTILLERILPDPVISKEVQDIVSKVAVATATTSSALGSVTGALYQARTGSFILTGECSFQHDEPLETMNSPTGFGFGPAHGRYYRGAVVGNFLIFGCITLFFVFVTFLIYNLRRYRKIPARTGSGSKYDDWLDAVATVHFPSVLLIPTGLGLQGTVAASMAIFLHSRSPTDIVLGVFGGLSCLSLLVFFVYPSLPCYFRLELQERLVVEKEGPQRGATNSSPEASDDDGGDAPLGSAARTSQKKRNQPHRKRGDSLLARQKTCCKAYLDKIMIGDQHWVDPEPELRWKRRYLFLFFDYNRPYFLPLEMGVSFILGILDGVRVNDHTSCLVQAIVSLLLFSIMFILAITLRPSLTKFQQGFILLIYVCSIVAAGFLIAILASPTGDIATRSWVKEVPALAAFIVSLLGILKFLLDLWFAALWAYEMGCSLLVLSGGRSSSSRQQTFQLPSSSMADVKEVAKTTVAAAEGGQGDDDLTLLNEEGNEQPLLQVLTLPDEEDPFADHLAIDDDGEVEMLELKSSGTQKNKSPLVLVGPNDLGFGGDSSVVELLSPSNNNSFSRLGASSVSHLLGSHTQRVEVHSSSEPNTPSIPHKTFVSSPVPAAAPREEAANSNAARAEVYALMGQFDVAARNFHGVGGESRRSGGIAGGADVGTSFSTAVPLINNLSPRHPDERKRATTKRRATKVTDAPSSSVSSDTDNSIDVDGDQGCRHHPSSSTTNHHHHHSGIPRRGMDRQEMEDLL